MRPFDRRAARKEREVGHDDVGVLDGEPRTGFEYPAELVHGAKLDGEGAGAAMLDNDSAFGLGSGPLKKLDGGVAARKGLISRDRLLGRIDPAKRIASKDYRKEAARARREVDTEQLQEMTGARLPKAKKAHWHAREELRRAGEMFDELPAHHKGYMRDWRTLALVETLVVAFDGFVLHSVLKHSGLGLEGTVLFLMSVATPGVVLGINVAMGYVAGALALRMSSHWRPRVAIGVLVTGCVGLLLTFLLLAVFREQATQAHNEGIAEIAKGIKDAKTNFFVSPWWFAPLQVVGSLAAISLMALYVAGAEGRRRLAAIGHCTEAVASAAQQVLKLEQLIEETRRRVAKAIVEPHEIEADAAGAVAQIELDERAADAESEAEDGLRIAAEGQFRASYSYTKRVYENGKVRRVVDPTRNGIVDPPALRDVQVEDPEVHPEERPQISFDDVERNGYAR